MSTGASTKQVSESDGHISNFLLDVERYLTVVKYAAKNHDGDGKQFHQTDPPIVYHVRFIMA